MPEVQIDNHFKRGTTDHLIRSHNCSVTNTESFAIAPQRIRSHLLLLRSEYGDYFDTESSNCANSPLCSGVGEDFLGHQPGPLTKTGVTRERKVVDEIRWSQNLRNDLGYPGFSAKKQVSI